MKSCFCRGLWGDDVVPTFGKARKDVQRVIQGNLHPENIHTFSFGKDNTQWLASLGVESTMVSKDAIRRYTRRKKRTLPGEDPNQMAYGISIWHHKLDVIHRALSIYDEIVWLDWDVVLTQPVPNNFWAHIAKQQPLQATIRQMGHAVSGWRSFGGNQSPHGGFIYCRDKSIARNLITLQQVWPSVSDEHIMGLLVELWFGGWDDKSIQRWKDEGYEPDRYLLGRKQVFSPEQRIFKHGG